MKKFYLLLALVGMILFSSCSKVEENNDPIIGVWQKADRKIISETQKETSYKIWTFNDAYLGRYNHQLNQVETMKTDFSWVVSDNQYIISYPGTDLADEIVTLEITDKGEVLKNRNGEILAIRS